MKEFIKAMLSDKNGKPSLARVLSFQGANLGFLLVLLGSVGLAQVDATILITLLSFAGTVKVGQKVLAND